MSGRVCGGMEVLFRIVVTQVGIKSNRMAAIRWDEQQLDQIPGAPTRESQHRGQEVCISVCVCMCVSVCV